MIYIYTCIHMYIYISMYVFGGSGATAGDERDGADSALEERRLAAAQRPAQPRAREFPAPKARPVRPKRRRVTTRGYDTPRGADAAATPRGFARRAGSHQLDDADAGKTSAQCVMPPLSEYAHSSVFSLARHSASRREGGRGRRERGVGGREGGR
jgi:hypothetical protein